MKRAWVTPAIPGSMTDAFYRARSLSAFYPSAMLRHPERVYYSDTDNVFLTTLKPSRDDSSHVVIVKDRPVLEGHFVLPSVLKTRRADGSFHYDILPPFPKVVP